MSQEFEGDFSLKNITLYPIVDSNYGSSIDIKELVAEITIKESVLSASLYCSVVLQDIGQNLIGTVPIMGQERINIKVDTGGKQYTFDFYVYKIDGRTMQEKNQAYILHCCSLEALKNESFRITERLDGVKAHEFIQDKLSQITRKKLYFDESLHKFDMYVPNWRFFDTAIWFRPRTVAVSHKDSVGYLFWEGFNGFNFKSIDTLFEQTQYPNVNTKYSFAQGNTPNQQTKYRIVRYGSPRAFDIFEDARNGAFSHDACYIDINHRKFRVFRTTADDFWDESKHLGKLKPYRTRGHVRFDKGFSRMVYRPTTINTFGEWKKDQSTSDLDMVDEANKVYEKSLYRFYFMQYNTLDIAVPGDLDLHAGSVIDISIPSPSTSGTDNSVTQDDRISGKYLVNSISHILNRDKLRTRVTLTRDSFGGKNISDDKASKQQVNLGYNTETNDLK